MTTRSEPQERKSRNDSEDSIEGENRVTQLVCPICNQQTTQPTLSTLGNVWSCSTCGHFVIDSHFEHIGIPPYISHRASAFTRRFSANRPALLTAEVWKELKQQPDKSIQQKATSLLDNLANRSTFFGEGIRS